MVFNFIYYPFYAQRQIGVSPQVDKSVSFEPVSKLNWVLRSIFNMQKSSEELSQRNFECYYRIRLYFKYDIWTRFAPRVLGDHTAWY